MEWLLLAQSGRSKEIRYDPRKRCSEIHWMGPIDFKRLFFGKLSPIRTRDRRHAGSEINFAQKKPRAMPGL
jgi:hypothetical protein